MALWVPSGQENDSQLALEAIPRLTSWCQEYYFWPLTRLSKIGEYSDYYGSVFLSRIENNMHLCQTSI